jgi:2-polyprenyl-3-methyl-5-hydroxy-6-metoxy-1,4-benzoquinol methylase
MPFLAVRDRQPELMDDPALDPAEHRRALAGLARINRWSGSARLLWPPVRDLARRLGRPLRLLDVATGSGDIPLAVWKLARDAGLPLDITALDLSPIAIETAARSAATLGATVRFAVADALADPLPGGFDVVTCSLFLHHLDEPDAVKLLAKMAAAGNVVLVNDLTRSRLNYGLVWLAARLFSRSPVVHADGPLSIRGAFTVAEMQRMADEAGMSGADVRAKFPCRMLLSWRKPE